MQNEPNSRPEPLTPDEVRQTLEKARDSARELLGLDEWLTLRAAEEFHDLGFGVEIAVRDETTSSDRTKGAHSEREA